MYLCVCVCIKQEHMDQCFETLREQMKQSDESVKRLQENIQREVSFTTQHLWMFQRVYFVICF